MAFDNYLRLIFSMAPPCNTRSMGLQVEERLQPIISCAGPQIGQSNLCMDTLDHAPNTCIINGHSSHPKYSIVLARFANTKSACKLHPCVHGIICNPSSCCFSSAQVHSVAIYSSDINDNFRSCLLGKLVVVVVLRYAQYCSKKHLFRFGMRWGSALTANVTQQPLESTISGLKCSRCISKTSCSKKRLYRQFSSNSVDLSCLNYKRQRGCDLFTLPRIASYEAAQRGCCKFHANSHLDHRVNDECSTHTKRLEQNQQIKTRSQQIGMSIWF